jgi:hypothetical protein
MCRVIRPAPAPAPCPCSSLTRDTTQWCNTCWLQLCDLERDIAPDLPREPSARDILVTALLHLNTNTNHPTN